MSRVLHDAAGYELVRDGRVALQGCEPDCCGDGEPGRYPYFAVRACDACGMPQQFYVEPGIWSSPVAAERDCLYFPSWPPGSGGCGFIHRDDPLVYLPYPPTNPPPFTDGDVLIDQFSCCECCVADCIDSYHNDDQFTAVIARIIDQLLTWYGIDLHVAVPACCCPVSPSYMYGVQFDLKRWDRQEWTWHTNGLFLERRWRARGIFSIGDVQARIRMRFDDYWYDDHFDCDNARVGVLGDRCQAWPDIRMGPGDCPDIGYIVTLGTTTIIDNPYGSIDRARLRVTCNSIEWDFAQTIRSSTGQLMSRFLDNMVMTWEYPLTDPCLQPCAGAGGKVPRPDGPPSFREPIGVQRFF